MEPPVLQTATPIHGPRCRRAVVQLAASGATLIDATASPDPRALRRHLHLLDHYADLGAPTAAVLGPLAATAGAHRAAGALLRRLPVGRLLTVGPAAQRIGEEARAERWTHHATVAHAASALLRRPLDARALVLVQASPDAGLDRLVASLVTGRPVARSE